MIDKAPRISIIIPAYNAANFIERSLQSVLNQSFCSFEVVCVDDGSTDDTAAIIRSYSGKDPRIRLIQQENGGAAAARRTGIAHASGDYIFILDSDDEISSDALESSYAVAQSSRADITLLDFYFCYADGRRKKFDLSDIGWPLSSKAAFSRTIGRWRIHAFGLYRKEVFLSVYQSFSLHSYDADEVVTQLAFLASKIVSHCSAEYFYFIHGSSTTRSISTRWFECLDTHFYVINLAKQSGLYPKVGMRLNGQTLRLYRKARKNLARYHEFSKAEKERIESKIQELASRLSKGELFRQVLRGRGFGIRCLAASLLIKRLAKGADA